MLTVPPANAVTTPVVLLTVATEGLVLLQVPPVPVVVKVPVAVGQSVAGPLTVPALGAGATVIGVLVAALPQLPDTE